MSNSKTVTPLTFTDTTNTTERAQALVRVVDELMRDSSLPEEVRQLLATNEAVERLKCASQS